MKITCEYAQGNEFNRIVCKAGENLPLCTCQRYCTMESEWQNTDKVSQCERRKTYMSNKGYNNYNKEEKSFVTEPELKEIAPEVVEEPKEEAPIEVAPEVKEEVKKEVVPEIRQEVKPQFKSQPKQQAKVILITRDGCIAERIGQPGNNVCFFGESYRQKNLGDIVEF